MKKRKIIIDTDPGGDDALAIAMLLQDSDVEILGITTTFGNVSLDQTTKNALRLLDYFDRTDIPVIKGSTKPLTGKAITAEEFHGEDGLGNISLPYSKRGSLELNAVEFYRQQIQKNENEIDLIAIGPLTTIARLFIAYPDIINKINALYIMGGTFKIPTSNNNEEFNFFNDPQAVKIVLNSNVKKYLVPLDITDKVFLKEKQIFAFKKTQTLGGELLYMISRFWKKKLSPREPFILWDPAGVGPFLKPNLFKFKKVALDISLDPLTKGKLTILKNGAPTTNLALNVDAKNYIKFFKNSLCK